MRADLINLDCRIDDFHEIVSSQVAERSAHNAQNGAEKSHVSEVEGRLEQTIHFGLEKEIVE